jgi:hypothetical protein
MLIDAEGAVARAPDVGSCDAAAQQNSHRRARQGGKGSGIRRAGSGAEHEGGALPVEHKKLFDDGFGLSCSDPGANRRDRLVMYGSQCSQRQAYTGGAQVATATWSIQSRLQSVIACGTFRVLQHITGLLCQLHLGCFFAAPPCCYDVMWVRRITVHINPGKP